MSVLLSLPSASGDFVIEVDRPGAVVRGGGADTVQKAAMSFEECWSYIKPVTNQTIKQLNPAIRGTEDVKVKFGVKFAPTMKPLWLLPALGANCSIAIALQKPRGSR
jgi:hypothetical protein